MKLFLFTTGAPGGELIHRLAQEHEILGVCGQPKGPAPRGHIFEGYRAAWVSAQWHNIRFYPDTALGSFNLGNPDVLIVCGFPRLIPKPIYESVPLAFNIHPAPLPKYRGPTPLPWIMHNREKETGATAHLLTDKFDAGPILAYEPTPINETDDLGTVARNNLKAIVRVAVRVLSERPRPTPQDETNAKYWPRWASPP